MEKSLTGSVAEIAPSPTAAPSPLSGTRRPSAPIALVATGGDFAGIKSVDTPEALTDLKVGEFVNIALHLVGDNPNNARFFYRASDIDQTAVSMQKNSQLADPLCPGSECPTGFATATTSRVRVVNTVASSGQRPAASGQRGTACVADLTPAHSHWPPPGTMETSLPTLRRRAVSTDELRWPDARQVSGKGRRRLAPTRPSARSGADQTGAPG